VLLWILKKFDVAGLLSLSPLNPLIYEVIHIQVAEGSISRETMLVSASHRYM